MRIFLRDLKVKKLRLWWLRIKYRRLMYECPYRETLTIQSAGRETRFLFCNIKTGNCMECDKKNPWDCPEFLDMEK